MIFMGKSMGFPRNIPKKTNPVNHPESCQMVYSYHRWEGDIFSGKPRKPSGKVGHQSQGAPKQCGSHRMGPPVELA